SGRRLANVTPVRSGGRRSNSRGSRTRLQPASASAASSNTAIGSGDRWPLRFGSLTTTPHTPGSLTSGATGRVADVPAPPVGGAGDPLGVIVGTYGAGRIRIACPPPGASTRCSRDRESTGRLEIATGNGFVSQFAPGPSA